MSRARRDDPRRLAAEIGTLMTPQMPEGIMDALKMLPMVGRLRRPDAEDGEERACQEIVSREGSLDELPILTCWPGDGGRYITFPLVFTGYPNLASATSAPTGCRCTTAARPACTGSARGRAAYRVAERLGTRLEVAVARGTASLRTRAMAPMPEGLDELLLAGFLAGRRIEIVKCVSVDLEYPPARRSCSRATSTGERRREGPFGDHTGLYSQPDEFPVFHLTCLTRRERPDAVSATVVACRRWRLLPGPRERARSSSR